MRLIGAPFRASRGSTMLRRLFLGSIGHSDILMGRAILYRGLVQAFAPTCVGSSTLYVSRPPLVKNKSLRRWLCSFKCNSSGEGSVSGVKAPRHSPDSKQR